MSPLKQLVLFIHPLGFAWLVIGLWLIQRLWKRELRSVWLPAIAWLGLTLFTCTPLTSLLLLGLEDQYPSVKIEDAPTADAIICLGGGAAPSLHEPARVNFNNSVDRMTSALGLLAVGKAPILIVTGGGYEEAGVMHSEADAAVAYLKQTLKLPQPIESLGVCLDTHDEALKISVMAKEKGWKRVLLVTSAAHMPRSVAVFTKAGVKVDPIPCDYLSSFKNIGDRKWIHLPSLNSNQGIAAWIHEVLGLVVYRLRGWI
jgi:uncharacterized SAM-binding protein YcdF (DUF218 family)